MIVRSVKHITSVRVLIKWIEKIATSVLMLCFWKAVAIPLSATTKTSTGF